MVHQQHSQASVICSTCSDMDTAGTAYLDLTAEYIIFTDHVTVEQEKCLIQQCHRSLAATAVGIV